MFWPAPAKRNERNEKKRQRAACGDKNCFRIYFSTISDKNQAMNQESNLLLFIVPVVICARAFLCVTDPLWPEKLGGKVGTGWTVGRERKNMLFVIVERNIVVC